MESRSREIHQRVRLVSWTTERVDNLEKRLNSVFPVWRCDSGGRQLELASRNGHHDGYPTIVSPSSWCKDSSSCIRILCTSMTLASWALCRGIFQLWLFTSIRVLCSTLCKVYELEHCQMSSSNFTSVLARLRQWRWCEQRI